MELMLSDWDAVVWVSLCREHVDLVRMAEFSPDSSGQVVTLIWSPDGDPVTTAMLPCLLLLCLLCREADLPRLLDTLTSLLTLVFRDSREKEAATAGIGTMPVTAPKVDVPGIDIVEAVFESVAEL